MPNRFSDKKYILPFGRYVGTSEVEPPADEVLVGREGQRAYLIDLLISTGRRGAYLVTGRRGTGKTSFVKYCISEYRASVFSRFLRNNVGRGVWDRLLVLLFWLAILAGALVASEAAQAFVLSLPEGNMDLPVLFLLIPAGVLLFYPSVYSKVAIEGILRYRSELKRRPTDHASGVRASIGVFLLGLAGWITPLGKPATIVTFLFIPVCSALYAAVQAVSYESKRLNRKGLGVLYWTRWLALVLFLLAAISSLGITLSVVLPTGQSIRTLFARGLPSALPGNDENWRVLGFCLTLGAFFMGCGLCFRGLDQRRRVRLIPKPGDLSDALKNAIRSGAAWYFGIGLISLFSGGFFLYRQLLPMNLTWSSLFPPMLSWSDLLRPSLVGLLVYLILLLLLHFAVLGAGRIMTGVEEGAPEQPCALFRPRPTWILAGKAILSIVVALQLSYPVFSHFVPWVLGKLDRTCPFSSSLCQASLSRVALFSGRTDEKCWLFALLVGIGLVYFLEYEWIIRPYVRSREDRAFGAGLLAPWEDWEDEDDAVPIGRRRRVYNSLAELTLPWATYKAWLPVMSVGVNLGFDRLDHRHVIQAMLVGLRERYHRAFHAWNSGFANLGRFVGILILLVLLSLISRQLQQPPCSSTGSVSIPLDAPLTQGRFWLALVTQTTCFKVDSRVSSHLLFLDLLPHTDPVAPPLYIYISIYHPILFVLLLFLGQWMLRKIPFLPYQENLQRMDNLLDSLSARTKVTSSLSLWGPARWVYSMFSEDNMTKETERDPLDPRTVELAFLQILEDVQTGGFRFPGAARHHLTLPAPEITFVFDELDKLGTRVDPAGDVRDISPPKQETIHSERDRSLRLRSLLSDLKNILSSAPARFIFVGGREMHDEWLADQTSRMPLLTSIFNTEVYLPSLCTDRAEDPSLHSQVNKYFLRQYDRALRLYYRSVRKRWLPSFGLSVEAISQERFAGSDENLREPIVFDLEEGDDLSFGAQRTLLDDFVLFLTYRSMGNPKKLKDLLATFIRPAGREIQDKEVRRKTPPSRHVIRLGHTEIFRIGLLVSIYRHLTQAFGKRMMQRDDKYVVSIFFLTDFLFKFHRRAFSWSNLERVDDLAHIHRLPDLREIQEEIVDHFSERFLHRVMNGIYSFRFRSDVAREVEYLSRQSSFEMAALNFTLDESLSLKIDYRLAIEGAERENPDLVAALGELHEFDQEFDQARHHYRGAIKLLDRGLGLVKGDVNEIIGEILHGRGKDHARIFLPWGVARMRLMLQIGMTFELERDLERAEAEYRSARTLARALVHAYIDKIAEIESNQSESDEAGPPEKKGARLHSLKHMNILSQPIFAEAWLSEKFVGTIDASVNLIERGLWEIRRLLPFVRVPKLVTRKKPEPSLNVERTYSNFSLTLSQLHNKAGDLFFFKGRQASDLERIRVSLSEAAEKSDSATDGYLLRAHYHYAVSLHDLRRYVHHRFSGSKWLSLAKRRKTATLRAESLPDYLFRAVAGNVNDMAEATLARISLFRIVQALGADERVVRFWYDADELRRTGLQWLGSDDEASRKSRLRNWFGPWKDHAEYGEARLDLLDFTGPNRACERLWMSLNLCIVGARFFEEGGYPEDAGRELLQVCETVTRYLWWGLILERIGGSPLSKTVFQDLPTEDFFETPTAWEFWGNLIDTTIASLERAGELFRQSRFSPVLKKDEASQEKTDKNDETYSIGTIVPSEALTILCSLGLAIEAIPAPKKFLYEEALRAKDLKKALLYYGQERARANRIERLTSLMKSWVGAESEAFSKIEESGRTLGSIFRAALEASLQRHSYPMINHLNGIKVLIDSMVWKCWNEPDQEIEKILGWTQELLDLNERFGAPLHFTPLLSGSTCALVWLWGSSVKDAKRQSEIRKNLERTYRAAQQDLDNSEEMYTMRRSYYKAISGLYFLYDDFNDRQIHYNHAIQMAGAELTAVLKHLIDHREEVEKALRPS